VEYPAGNQVALQPVEGVADDGQFEIVRWCIERLGAGHDGSKIPHAGVGRLGTNRLDHVPLLVYGPYFCEVWAQREGELAGPAGRSSRRPRPERWAPETRWVSMVVGYGNR
jgi:hypothetical protein